MLRQPVDGSAKMLNSLCHYLLCMPLQPRRGTSCAQLFANPKRKDGLCYKQLIKSKYKMITERLIQSDAILRRRYNASHYAQSSKPDREGKGSFT